MQNNKNGKNIQINISSLWHADYSCSPHDEHERQSQDGEQPEGGDEGEDEGDDHPQESAEETHVELNVEVAFSFFRDKLLWWWIFFDCFPGRDSVSDWWFFFHPLDHRTVFLCD